MCNAVKHSVWSMLCCPALVLITGRHEGKHVNTAWQLLHPAGSMVLCISCIVLRPCIRHRACARHPAFTQTRQLGCRSAQMCPLAW